MKENKFLKRGLIIQSLSPLFALLIIRHFHCDYVKLIYRFSNSVVLNFWETIFKAITHPRFGELLIVAAGSTWIVLSFISIHAFKETEKVGFKSYGEIVVNVEEKGDAASSFIITFILPLLIDELSTPQEWISYCLLIILIYSVLYKSNLYYQNPILSLLGYKVFSFQIKNPYTQTIFKTDKTYIGISRNSDICEEAVIMWKYVSDDVFLVYREGVKSQ